MRILVGWDDADQADLLKLYLDAEDSDAEFFPIGPQLLEAAGAQPWEAALLAVGGQNDDPAYDVFCELKRCAPDLPIVGACPTTDMYRIARYLTSGLRGYVIRDGAGDFMFLVRAVIEAAVKQAEAERVRYIADQLRREIDSVRKLQDAIIPRKIDSPSGFHIVARYEAAQIRVVGGQPVTLAGGDYYDAFVLPDETIVLLVGDASGHGMKACMSIMTMHTLIRMIRSNAFRDAGQFVAHVNNQLCEQAIVNEDGGFITLLYAILNPKTNTLQWASAGHPTPLLHRFEDNSVIPITGDDVSGLPLGIVPDAEYTVVTSSLPPDSRLLLYTDGIIEAFSDDEGSHREFGQNGLVSTMLKCRAASLSETLQQLFDDSLAFTNGLGRHDDTSVLLVERSS